MLKIDLESDSTRLKFYYGRSINCASTRLEWSRKSETRLDQRFEKSYPYPFV
jgi:hypothetical protein